MIDHRVRYQMDTERLQFTPMFDECSIRHKFVKKVYSIVGLQLLVVVACVLLFMYIPAILIFVKQHSYIIYVVGGLYIVISLSISCVRSARQTFPCNMLLLFICTGCMGFLMGCMCALSSPKLILIAGGSTILIVIALTLFAFQVKWDFTGCGPFLLIGMILLLIIGLVAAFVHVPALHIVYSSIGLLFFSIALVVDTQLMLGGRHRYAISPEDYVMAALCIFTDIIGLFVHILNLMHNVN